VNAFLIAATALLGGFALCSLVCVRAQVIDAVIALQLGGSVMVTILICLAQGLHSSTSFNLPVVCALLVSINALVFARFMGRFLR
jgi:multisubunit Na+/H+ antiporter MnhF subunit